MSDEKKFKLDELPDEGSEPVKKAPPKRTAPRPSDPRISQVKNLKTDKARVEMMEQSWTFDLPDYSFTWVPWLVVLGAAEWSGYFANVRSDLEKVAENPFAIGADVFASLLSVGTLFLKHPIIFLAFFPLFFRLQKPSEYLFEVKFDGINTVKKYIPRGSKEILSRTLLKWDSIGSVTKIKIDGKEILRITSPDGHIADIIWYIENEKKRALKLLLSGMISPKNPLRVFLDSEKELK